METSDALGSFIEGILFEKGADALPQEVQDQMKQDLLERVERRINIAMLAAMPPEEVVNFEKILDAGSDTAVQAFVARHVPHADEVIAKELVEFKSLYLSA